MYKCKHIYTITFKYEAQMNPHLSMSGTLLNIIKIQFTKINQKLIGANIKLSLTLKLLVLKSIYRLLFGKA